MTQLATTLNKHKEWLLIVLITILGLFFRLWKLKIFQYWSDDEQIFWSVVKHIVADKHPSLGNPNSALGITMGPLFHYFVAPWFWIVKFDPEKILLFGNFFSLLSIPFFYIVGKEIKDKKTGLTAAFLYSASFMASLFDRRLWSLSPNVLFMLIAIFSLTRILKGDSKFLLLLTTPVAFSLNSDPSLGVIALSTLITLIIFRPKISLRYWLQASLLLTIMLSPLIIFEVRHAGINLKAIEKTLSSTQKEENRAVYLKGNFLLLQMENFSRFFYTTPTNSADFYFCYYCKLDKRPLVITLIALFMLIAFLKIAISERNKSYFLLLIILSSYLIGIFIFSLFFKGSPAFFYSITISPAIFLIASTVITKSRYLITIFLIVFLIINIYSLKVSRFRYPLEKKMDLVRDTVKKLIPGLDFSLYYSGDTLLADGGWTALFMSQGYYPAKGTLAMYWGHLYVSYGLLSRPFSEMEPQTVVIISSKDGEPFSKIINNKNGDFDWKKDIEKLYNTNGFN